MGLTMRFREILMFLVFVSIGEKEIRVEASESGPYHSCLYNPVSCFRKRSAAPTPISHDDVSAAMLQVFRRYMRANEFHHPCLYSPISCFQKRSESVYDTNSKMPFKSSSPEEISDAILSGPVIEDIDII